MKFTYYRVETKLHGHMRIGPLSMDKRMTPRKFNGERSGIISDAIAADNCSAFAQLSSTCLTFSECVRFVVVGESRECISITVQRVRPITFQPSLYSRVSSSSSSPMAPLASLPLASLQSSLFYGRGKVASVICYHMVAMNS